MSGVIDENGVQWEHCNVCNEFVQIDELLYEQPSRRFQYGRDIGPCCWDLSTDEQDAISERVRNRLRAVAERQKELLADEPEEEPARWVDNGDGSHSPHPDDRAKLQASLDRSMAAWRQAREEIPA